jgi:hypothetical protein
MKHSMYMCIYLFGSYCEMSKSTSVSQFKLIFFNPTKAQSESIGIQRQKWHTIRMKKCLCDDGTCAVPIDFPKVQAPPAS